MRKLNWFKRPALLVLALVIAISAAVWVYAKYIYQETIHGSLTITAKLGEITVLEHQAVRNKDGSYQLNANEVRENLYYLIPGLDIPKDPFVRLTDHSSLPVYVFIKVDTNLTGAHQVAYQLRSCWQPVAGTTNIYVYCVDDAPFPVTSDMEILILENNLVEVKQGLSVTGQVFLNFTAAMGQQDAGLDAATVMALFPVS